MWLTGSWAESGAVRRNLPFLFILLTVLVGVAVFAGRGSPASAAGPMCMTRPATVVLGAGDLPTDDFDVILGTPGPDVINALGGNDVICGAGGNDVINGGPGLEDVRGGPGADRLRGGANEDWLHGGPGPDVLRGGTGSDTCPLGAGDTRISCELSDS